MPVGRHNITIYAWDVAGNLGASETVAFNIAKPEPEPFPTIPVVVTASGASLAIIGVGLLMYFKKRRREAARYED